MNLTRKNLTTEISYLCTAYKFISCSSGSKLGFNDDPIRRFEFYLSRIKITIHSLRIDLFAARKYQFLEESE